MLSLRMGTALALMIVACAAVTPTAQAERLTDTKLGRTESALREQARHSHLVVRFFERHPMIAVPWRERCSTLRLDMRERNCRVARNLIHLHRWLRKEARDRLQGLNWAPSYSLGPLNCVSCWDRVASCESGGNWSINTGNGFLGGLQWLLSTWLAYGGGRYASSPVYATRMQQIAVASHMSLGHWPVCGARY